MAITDGQKKKFIKRRVNASTRPFAPSQKKRGFRSAFYLSSIGYHGEVMAIGGSKLNVKKKNSFENTGETVSSKAGKTRIHFAP